MTNGLFLLLILSLGNQLQGYSEIPASVCDKVVFNTVCTIDKIADDEVITTDSYLQIIGYSVCGGEYCNIKNFHYRVVWWRMVYTEDLYRVVYDRNGNIKNRQKLEKVTNSQNSLKCFINSNKVYLNNCFYIKINLGSYLVYTKRVEYIRTSFDLEQADVDIHYRNERPGLFSFNTEYFSNNY